jgi:hypothetical protein
VTRTQLRELAEPFPASLVQNPPQGKQGAYVKHNTYNERLLSIVGPFDFEVLEPIRGATKSRPDAVVGCLARLTVTIDGERHTIVEVGTEDHPDNGHDAKNLKNAASDALKRCAMRLGLGLHLWSQSDYFLDKQLDKDAGGVAVVEVPSPSPARDGDAPDVHEICPKCERGGVYDNRAENERRRAAGEKPMPEFACRERDDCGWIKWADEWTGE